MLFIQLVNSFVTVERERNLTQRREGAETLRRPNARIPPSFRSTWFFPLVGGAAIGAREVIGWKHIFDETAWSGSHAGKQAGRPDDWKAAQECRTPGRFAIAGVVNRVRGGRQSRRECSR